MNSHNCYYAYILYECNHTLLYTCEIFRCLYTLLTHDYIMPSFTLISLRESNVIVLLHAIVMITWR